MTVINLYRANPELIRMKNPQTHQQAAINETDFACFIVTLLPKLKFSVLVTS